jgi:hypothetical protein
MQQSLAAAAADLIKYEDGRSDCGAAKSGLEDQPINQNNSSE